MDTQSLMDEFKIQKSSLMDKNDNMQSFKYN